MQPSVGAFKVMAGWERDDEVKGKGTLRIHNHRRWATGGSYS